MSLDPWMIEQLEEERRREEEERARQQRIELPQTRPADGEETPRDRGRDTDAPAKGRVTIVQISPVVDDKNVVGI